MAKIKHIYAREILNGEGNPAVEVAAELTDGTIGVASCPSGVTIGSYGAVSLVDKDPMRFHGLGVQNAIKNITDLIAPKLLNIEASKQRDIDKIMIEMDGTQNKARLGANAMIGVSMAVAKAAAMSSVLPLFLYLREFLNDKNSPVQMPIPLFTVMS
ncbi:MAG: phosphopyruvate hydratase, partial [Candidatus Levyibacteriota bacterium]